MNNWIASSASDSEGTRNATSPATEIGSRLVANNVKRGQSPKQPNDQRGARIQEVLTVVEHNQHLPVGH